MDEVRFGRTVRALRLRLGWRQQDLGDSAGVSQDVISLVERGFCQRVQLGTLEAIVEALGADMRLVVRWRGGDIDRLLDEGHAALAARTAIVLEAAGWAVAPEVTFAIYADRGSIDVLGWHERTATLLVVEVKTELTSLEETLRTQDMKSRHAIRVAGDRFAWRGRFVARLLVLPDTSTARRRVNRHAAILDRAYPRRGHDARAWLHDPSGPAGLLLYLSFTTGGRGKRGPVTLRRVRRAVVDRTERDSKGPETAASLSADGNRA